MTKDATWRRLIVVEMVKHGDSFFQLEKSSLSSEQLDARFDDSFGMAQGAPFLLWTKTRVYFPVVHDGAEWVGSVPRHPCDEVAHHFGGE